MPEQLVTRIAPLGEPDGPAGMPPLNIFATLKKAPELHTAFLALGQHLLAGQVVPAREREMVILRTGWRSSSEYEFGQHTRIGLRVGVTDAEVVGLAGIGDPGWSADDLALLDMVDELCADNVVGADTWATLAQRWSEAQLLEFLVLAGYYRLVSGMLNSAGVPLEPRTPGWPDGAEVALLAPRAAGE